MNKVSIETINVVNMDLFSNDGSVMTISLYRDDLIWVTYYGEEIITSVRKFIDSYDYSFDSTTHIFSVKLNNKEYKVNLDVEDDNYGNLEDFVVEYLELEANNE